MEAQRVTWPSQVRNLPWPQTGITYSYENRGYIHPEKLQCWLEKAFGGRDKADYRVRSANCRLSYAAICQTMPPAATTLAGNFALLILLARFSMLCCLSQRSKPGRAFSRPQSSRTFCEPFAGIRPCPDSLSQANGYDWQLLHGRIYIKAPREPTKVSEWQSIFPNPSSQRNATSVPQDMSSGLIWDYRRSMTGCRTTTNAAVSRLLNAGG